MLAHLTKIVLHDTRGGDEEIWCPDNSFVIKIDSLLFETQAHNRMNPHKKLKSVTIMRTSTKCGKGQLKKP